MHHVFLLPAYIASIATMLKEEMTDLKAKVKIYTMVMTPKG